MTATSPSLLYSLVVALAMSVRCITNALSVGLSRAVAPTTSHSCPARSARIPMKLRNPKSKCALPHLSYRKLTLLPFLLTQTRVGQGLYHSALDEDRHPYNADVRNRRHCMGNYPDVCGASCACAHCGRRCAYWLCVCQVSRGEHCDCLSACQGQFDQHCDQFRDGEAAYNMRGCQCCCKHLSCIGSTSGFLRVSQMPYGSVLHKYKHK